MFVYTLNDIVNIFGKEQAVVEDGGEEMTVLENDI